MLQYGIAVGAPSKRPSSLLQEPSYNVPSLAGLDKSGPGPPRQPQGPVEKSTLSQLLHNFTGMTASLLFSEDGLHAVVIIERK